MLIHSDSLSCDGVDSVALRFTQSHSNLLNLTQNRLVGLRFALQIPPNLGLIPVQTGWPVCLEHGSNHRGLTQYCKFSLGLILSILIQILPKLYMSFGLPRIPADSLGFTRKPLVRSFNGNKNRMFLPRFTQPCSALLRSNPSNCLIKTCMATLRFTQTLAVPL